MMIRRSGVFSLVIVLLSSCGGTDREKANTYFEEFSAIIVPYKEGSERILAETQGLLQKQLRASGHLKLSGQDSLRQNDLLKELQGLASTTIDNLNDLGDFPESDLKDAGIAYVQKSTDAMIGAYRAIERPMQDMNSPPDQQMVDSLSRKYSDDLTAAVDAFANSQIAFIEKFELLKTE